MLAAALAMVSLTSLSADLPTLAQAELAQKQADHTKAMADLAKTLQDPQVREMWKTTFGQAPTAPGPAPTPPGK